MKLSGILLLSTLSIICAGQSGKVSEHLTMKSKILNKDVNYSLYLPPDYESSKRNYPVVYLLHGFTDNDNGWLQFGEVNRYADNAINSGEIPPMIIAMPDGGVTWYLNNYDGSVRYEDFFIQEFIPFIDATYRTRPLKEYRGIAGLSMGGYGSLLNSLKHPDMFAACSALSSGVHTDEDIINMPDDGYERIYKNLFVKSGTKGKDRLSENWYRNSIVSLVQKNPIEEIKKVRFYLDCGDDDFLYRGNSTLHIAFRDRGIPHEFRIRDGGHSWEYWRTGITDALTFIGQSFRR